MGLRCRVYSSSAGILTCFPFGVLQLGYVLGSANPQLIIIAEEPLPFRWSRFSLDFAVTIDKILIFVRSTQSYD
jgi:hypothetical protein